MGCQIVNNVATLTARNMLVMSICELAFSVGLSITLWFKLFCHSATLSAMLDLDCCALLVTETSTR